MSLRRQEEPTAEQQCRPGEGSDAGLAAETLPSASLVFAVLIATMLGFGASMAYSHHVASSLDENAESIATDAAPAIEHLSAARGDLLRIQLAAVSALRRLNEGTSLDRAPFADALSRLHRELDAYGALPFYPDERQHYLELDEAARSVDLRLSDVLGHLERGEGNNAVTALRNGLVPAASRADAAIDFLISFNAQQQHRLGVEIPALRRHAERVGYCLAAITAGFGLLLMVLVTRAIRRYTNHIQAQNRLAEAHAREVAAFGSKLESLIAASVKISGTITAADETQRVFQTIADEARSIVNARYCAVGCGGAPGRPFDVWVTSGMPESAAKALGRPPKPEGLLGAVIRDGHLIRLANLTDHPAFRGFPPHHPPMGPFLGVPIVHDGRNVGNLYLSRAEGAAAFSEEDERVAELLAGYVGVSISNSRLYTHAVAATRAREDLLATVSHDLKNPLSNILISAHLLRRQAPKSEALAVVERIERAAERMTRLIGDLLDAAKIEAGVLRTAPRPENAASLVDSVVEMLGPIAADKSSELRSQGPPSPVAVLCERDLILRVLSNLVGNAIKFSPSGGSVFVVAKERTGQVQFSVKDSGPGIPDEHLPHIFDRYWQQKDNDRRGSGLGLYIAKGIVEAHGGRIWIETAPGQGTAIHFSLPIAEQSAHPAGP
ncbi:MAG: ATP-binding protein [Myxococcales bacterium]